MSHDIALMALTMDGLAPGEHVPNVDEAFRCRLRPGELLGHTRDSELSETARDRVLAEIERRYAHQLRHRRQDLLGSLRGWLEAGGPVELTDHEWALKAAGPKGRQAVFLVTPRSPRPQDLRELDRLRRRTADTTGKRTDGYLIHSSGLQDPVDRKLIRWIRGSRPLHTWVHRHVPNLLGL